MDGGFQQERSRDFRGGPGNFTLQHPGLLFCAFDHREAALQRGEPERVAMKIAKEGGETVGVVEEPGRGELRGRAGKDGRIHGRQDFDVRGGQLPACHPMLAAEPPDFWSPQGRRDKVAREVRRIGGAQASPLLDVAEEASLCGF